MIFPPASQPRRQPRTIPVRGLSAGFTLLETMIGLGIFIIGGLGVIETLGLINNNSTVDRVMSAARLLVGAKIAKAQTDTWTPNNGVVPVGCVPSAGVYATQDTNDPFDFAATSTTPVTVIGSADTGANITGTMAQTVSTFEAASRTLLINYQLTFTYRGKNYTVSQSTIRAPDQL